MATAVPISLIGINSDVFSAMGFLTKLHFRTKLLVTSQSHWLCIGRNAPDATAG